MSKVKILIAEDEEVVGFIMQSALRQIRDDLEIEWVDNGEKALQKAMEFMPHVFILDWMMPTMSGLEVTKTLRKLDAFVNTPVVMVTSNVPSEENLAAAFDAGITDFISKPFNKVELKLRINAAIKASLSYEELVLSRLKAEHATRSLATLNRQLDITKKGLEGELSLQKDYNETLRVSMDLVRAAKEQLSDLYLNNVQNQ